MLNQTISAIPCMQQTMLGDIIIALTVYSILTSFFIFILLIIIFRILRKDKTMGAPNGTTKP